MRSETIVSSSLKLLQQIDGDSQDDGLVDGRAASDRARKLNLPLQGRGYMPTLSISDSQKKKPGRPMSVLIAYTYSFHVP